MFETDSALIIRRYFIQLSYDGTNYCGWQNQIYFVTIQEEIEKALTILCKNTQKILGCGRTDSGVHAQDYIAHWDCNIEIEDLAKFTMKMNSLLAKTIAIKRIVEVDNKAHARFDAYSRKYQYFIHTQKNPFKRFHSYEYVYKKIDFDLMNEVAMIIPNYEEFLPLIKLNKDNNSTRCKIFNSKLTKISDTEYMYEISANRFLHNMVRRIVGVLLLVGQKKMNIEEFKESMSLQSPMKYILLAPSCGLHLVEIKYPYEF